MKILRNKIIIYQTIYFNVIKLIRIKILKFNNYNNNFKMNKKEFKNFKWPIKI